MVEQHNALILMPRRTDLLKTCFVHQLGELSTVTARARARVCVFVCVSVCVCACVRACVCVFPYIIPYVNCFGRTVLYVCTEYCI